MGATDGDDPYLTTAEVATLLRTSEGTVRWWRHMGTGPDGVRIGRRVLYRRSAVDAWVEAKRRAEGGSAS